MKKRRSIRLGYFLWFLCLLISVTAIAQPPGYRRFTNAGGIYVSKIIATKNSGPLTVFIVPNSGGSGLATYSSIVQRTAANGQVLWSKRFENLAIADVLEARNGDLVFSGSEWQGGAFASPLNVFVLRTESDGSLLWRREVAFAKAEMPDTVLCKEQRLAETGAGKLYFQCRDASGAAGTFIAFYLTATGTLTWSRRITFPPGITFTDLTSAFDNSLLLSGTYFSGTAQASALLCVDTIARLKYIRTFTASADFRITQILKDETRRQYYLCGDGAGDAQGSYALAVKADADIESLTYLRATAVVPALFRCRNLPKTFGADAQGNIYCLYAGREGSSAYRKLISNDSAYLQLPACKFDAALNIAWRKRYVLPVDKNAAPFVSSAPQLVILNNKLVAAVQTGGEHTTAQPPSASWLMTTDTAGNTAGGCVATDEPFNVKYLTLVVGAIRANLITPGINMQSSQELIGRSFSPLVRDTCVARLAPKSRFTYLKTGGNAIPANVVCTDGTVSFFDNAFNEPQSWQWIFPRDADLSKADSSCFPDVYNVSFPKPGVYAVRLVVENSSGSDTSTQYITAIDPPPAPALGRDAVICPGDSVLLVYQDPPYATHAFYSIGGPFYSTKDTAIITTPGTFVCAVYSPCGTATDTIRISTAQQPKPAFATPLSCGDLTVAFTNTTQANGNTRLSYQWDFFDKNGLPLGSSGQADPFFTYPSFDTVKARLIVKSSLACIKPDTAEKTFVLHPKPVVSFTFGERCGDTNVSFSGTSSLPVGSVAGYAWAFGDGASDNAASPAHNYAVAGLYTVRFTAVSDAGCVSDASTQTVAVRAKPLANFTYNNDACEGKAFILSDVSTVAGSAVTGYYWRNASSGQVYSTAAITPVVAAAGDATFFHAVTSAQGCTSDTLTKDILVESIPLAAFNGGNGCAGDTLVFLSASNTTIGRIQAYQWTVSNGFSSTQQNPQFSFAASGSYVIKHKVISGNGCISNEAIKTITIYSLPQPMFTYSVPCLNVPVAFANTTAAAGNTWQWLVNGAPFSTQAAPSYNFTIPGNYNVQLQTTDGNGCKAAASKTITVEDFHLRLTAARNPVLPGEPLWLQTAAGVPYGVYAWTPASLFTAQTAKAQRVITEMPLSVQVFAQSALGCKDSASLALDIYALDDVYVPSAFTPNGDGRNDVLYVIGKDVTGLDFKVYNRWGEMVFTSRDKSMGWDGNVQGKAQTSGTYVYILRAKKANGQTVEKKGTVTIIR